MSRIGKRPVNLPKGVEVKLSGRILSVKGPKGNLSRELHSDIDVELNGQTISFEPRAGSEDAGRFHGLTRTLVSNMVVGVTDGFSRRLKLVGVGYRAAPQANGVTLSLGYSHPVVYDAPDGIELKVEAQTTIVVSGADKEMVGQVAAKIRGFRPPEPYHGKGVRYEDEHIATKVGKAAGKK